MDDIFEILIHIMMAYFQIIMILIGSVFVLFGGGAFLSVIQRQKKSRHWFAATVIAIREGDGVGDMDNNGARTKIYHPVFEGVGPDGQTRQYEYQSGSSDINKYKVGARYEVTLKEGQDNFVLMKSDDKADIIIGMVLCGIGAMMIVLSIKFIAFSELTFAVWAVTAIYMIFKFGKSIKPKHLRETVAQFRSRRGMEALMRHQSKPEVSQEFIKVQNKKFEVIRSRMAKVSLLVGFVMLCLGGAGYNAQLEFIENAVVEKVGPCGLELGEDCRRTILYQDALSVMPIELRPVMEGVYHSKVEPDKYIVSYGHWTPLPYFILMGLGALIILGNISPRRQSQTI